MIRECRKLCDNNNIIPDELEKVFVSLQKGCIEVVKSTNKYNLKSNQMKALQCLIMLER